MKEELQVTKVGTFKHFVLYPPKSAIESTIGWSMWADQIRYELEQLKAQRQAVIDPPFIPTFTYEELMSWDGKTDGITLTLDSDYDK